MNIDHIVEFPDGMSARMRDFMKAAVIAKGRSIESIASSFTDPDMRQWVNREIGVASRMPGPLWMACNDGGD